MIPQLNPKVKITCIPILFMIEWSTDIRLSWWRRFYRALNGLFTGVLAIVESPGDDDRIRLILVCD